MSPAPVDQAPPAGTATAADSGTRLRPEIQLLRALAVLAVVGNHLAPRQITGGYLGVDVFFVISGYLISAHLLRELDRTGRVRLGAFWARRARRLLPASLLVLLVSAAGTVLFVPSTQWDGVMRQITASALYVQNWALAADTQDYFASSNSPSPVTHYWSLSLEEQFYLVWPLLAFGAYVVGRRLGRPRRAVVAVFIVVVLASLTYSVVETSRNPSAAYFVTPTRIWELGMGGLLALVPLAWCVQAPAWSRRSAAVVGWSTLVGSVLLFDEGAPVPGWVALVPVLGAVAVIWAGDAFGGRVPRPVRPGQVAAVWVGGISYSLYLWHWPPVVLVPYATGHPLTAAAKVVLLAVVLVVSWLSARLVEDPVRRARWLTSGPLRRTFLPAAAAMALVVLVGTLVPATVQHRLDRLTDDINAALDSGDRCFAARAIANGCPDPHLLLNTDSTLLRVDNDTTATPAWGSVCIQTSMGAEVETCQFGVPRDRARLDVALVGDSHARQWSPALDEIARAHDWNVTTYLKASCPANAAPLRTRNYPQYVPSCRAWNADVARQIAADDDIDLVVTSGFSRNYVIDGLGPGQTPRAIAQGYDDLWSRWTATGKEIVAIGDVPRMQRGDIPTCVAESTTLEDPCTQSASTALTPDPMLTAVADADDRRVSGVDLHRFFCSAGLCHAVIGGLVAYGDENHILGFFAKSLAPYLLEQMGPAIPASAG
jgi:peptidoglycan/LPS O-acetylase OafA/YrhL